MPRKNFELYLSAFAVFISFIAAALSWWQLDIARQHNRISVRPAIVITPYLEGNNGRNGVYLTNQGLGPAILKSMKIVVDGREFSGLEKSHWIEALRQAGTEPICYKHGWPTQDAMIKVGEEEILLSPTSADLPACKLEAIILLMKKDIAITIHYESLYGEVFVAKGSTKMNVDFPQ